MSTQRNKLFVALLALLAVYVLPLRAETPTPGNTFFSSQQALGPDENGYPVYYLDYFNTYTYDPTDSEYVYKYGFGWLYYFGGTTSNTADAYFYDFIEDDVLYTSSDAYPYFYSFNLGSWLYYFEGSSPRDFYDFDNDTYITY